MEMEKLLAGIPGVLVYLDDILITGRDESEHLQSLKRVFQKLKEKVLRVDKNKCSFLRDSVSYLGYVVSKNGLETCPRKVDTVVKMKRPENVTELKSFLGLVNYYGKFVKDLSTVANPLNKLLRGNEKWLWSQSSEKAFLKLKYLLSNAPILAHYDISLPIKLECDASSVGVGAVISHVYPNGEERPIAYAARSLSPAERNYAQIEKEALSLVYGVKYFHQFLYGRKFTLVTDHKPLMSILSPTGGLPPLAAARLQRYAIILAAYSYDLEFRSSLKHGNADALSRLGGHNARADVKDESSIFNIEQLSKIPVNSKDISAATRTDPVLSKVVEYIMTGWPHHVDDDLKLFKMKELELTVEDGCFLWGRRVVIPAKHQHLVLNELHSGHQGIVKTKSLARLHVWWPNIDKDIETLVLGCGACNNVKNKPAAAPLHPWEWPSFPWQRIHLDFAGPFLGKYFLVLVDAYSKWIEVEIMNNITTESTINFLRQKFACYGIPELIVSDNGAQFRSGEFEIFAKSNGIRQIFSAPYKPSTNGEAERAVQTFKQNLKKFNSNSNLGLKLCQFLIQYRTTPQTATGLTPAELFLRRQLRTRLDLLKPSKDADMRYKSQVQHANSNVKLRTFHLGQEVQVLDFSKGYSKWAKGTIIGQTGPVSYTIQVGENVWRRHVDEMLALRSSDLVECGYAADKNIGNEKNDREVIDYHARPQHKTIDLQNNEPSEVPQPSISSQHEIDSSSSQISESQTLGDSEAMGNSSLLPRRYPLRERRPPDRLNYSE